jgi:GDP-mannose 6-dehydrogenase
VLRAIEKTNKIQKKKLLKLLLRLNKNRIGILGLSFKYGTDDLRDSPIIYIIQQLRKRGLHVKILDENISLTKLAGANKTYIMREMPDCEKIMLYDIRHFLKQSDVIVINHAAKKTILKLQNLPAHKVIIDLAYIKQLFRKKNYIGFNW